MNIDNLTIGEAKEISRLVSGESKSSYRPWETGENYIIRTVTMTLVGKVAWVGPMEIVLHNASWIADTGRFSGAIMKGSLSEVEPFDPEYPVIVGRGSVIDATRWIHRLPEEQK